MRYLLKKLYVVVFTIFCFFLCSNAQGQKPGWVGSSYLAYHGDGATDRLFPGQYIVSPGGLFYFIMQHNGQAAIYTSHGPNHHRYQIWATPRMGSDASLIGIPNNGGLGIWTDRGQQYLWTIGPTYDKPCYLIIQDDGNLVLYAGTGPDDQGEAIWASGTNKSITITDIENIQYDLSKATQSKPTLANSISQKSCNCNTLEETSDLELSTSYSTSSTWTNSIATEVSASVTVSVGVPEIASGSVTVGASETSTFSNGKAISKTETESSSGTLKAAPKTKSAATLLVYTSKISVPYTATATYKVRVANSTPWEGTTDFTFKGPLTGTYSGTTKYNSIVTYSTPVELPCHNPDQPCSMD